MVFLLSLEQVKQGDDTRDGKTEIFEQRQERLHRITSINAGLVVMRCACATPPFRGCTRSHQRPHLYYKVGSPVCQGNHIIFDMVAIRFLHMLKMVGNC